MLPGFHVSLVKQLANFGSPGKRFLHRLHQCPYVARKVWLACGSRGVESSLVANFRLHRIHHRGRERGEHQFSLHRVLRVILGRRKVMHKLESSYW